MTAATIAAQSRYRVAPYQYHALIGSGHTPSRSVDAYWQDCDIPWLTTGDVKHLRSGVQQVISETEHQISRLGMVNSAARLHPAGTVALSRTASVGFAAIFGREMATSQDFVTWTPFESLDARYLLWVFRAMKGNGDFDRMMYGSTHKTIYYPQLQQLRGPLPSLEVQRRVADLLDVETAHIDTLIAKNRRVLDSLDTRRIAAATHLVSRRGVGTPPSDHPSAFWVGSVPPAWKVAALGLRYEVQLGKMLSAERRESGDQRPYLANVNVQWDRIEVSDLRTMDFTDSDWVRYGVEPGDVLICEGGDIGRAAIWPDDGPFGVHYQKALHRARPLDRDADNPRWLYYALFVAAKTGVFQFGAEASTIDHLTGERLREHRFPFPPRHEQDRLVAELDVMTEHIRTLMHKVTYQQELLRTRREALITAAVTGQIDI